MKIEIKNMFPDDHITRIAGEKLRNMILSCDEIVELDFSNVKIASASFFDEGIAKLALEGWSVIDFKNRIKITNIFSKDKMLLKNSCKIRGIIFDI
jgi:hypothetical protein